MKTKNSQGFSVVEILLVVVIVAVLGFVGWRVWDTQFNKPATDTAQTNTVEAPAVEKASDLDEAAKAVDDINLDSSDAELTELEKELDSL